MPLSAALPTAVAADPPLLHLPAGVLRPLCESDAASIARHADDEQVWRNLFEGFPRPYTLQHARDWCGGAWRSPDFGHVWAIDVRGEAVGCIGVRPEDGWLACNAEVGYWLGRTHWGRGIATQALTAATQWAWSALPQVHRLYAPIYARNPASQRVAAKAGYVLEGQMPKSCIKAGEVIDRVVYACYRP